MSTTNPKVSNIGGSGRHQAIDYYNSGSAINAGDVVVINSTAHFAVSDIAASALGALIYSGGVWSGNKASGTWTLGNAVYWNPTGTPNVGTASSGAFTQTYTAGTCIFVGYCVLSPVANAAAATADQYGYFVKSNAAGTAQGVSIAATGSTVADAALLAAGYDLVTAADGTKGVILPAGVIGQISVKNSDAANAVLKVYPPTGGVINALSANGAISMAAKTSAIFASADGLNFATIPLLPS